MSDDFKSLIAKVASGAELTREEAARRLRPHDVGRGDALADGRPADGPARARRDRRRDHRRGDRDARQDAQGRCAADAIDVVGTGGDASGSFNISTCAAFIVAGADVPVAKHGNRALSSRSGSADVLGALGVKIDLTSEQVGDCIRDAGIGFMFAPAHHPAMKNVGPTRVELGTRTIFNLLGPLSNPAGVKRQMIGAYSQHWIEPMAHVLKNLGSECVWVAHGSDGLDEITTSGPTAIAALENGKVRSFVINPEDVGLSLAKPETLRGGDAETNANALKAVLKGTKGPFRDIAVFNAAATLVVAGKAEDLKDGVALAAKSIDSGAAEARLDRLVAVSNIRPE